MPLHDIEEVCPGRLMALFHITETYPELFLQLTSASDDQGLLNSFSNEQKKKEWLAGRITLKILSEKYGLPYKGVKKDPTGKPYLREHDVEISLSHSFPYAAAIIDRKHGVGIDLEQPKDKLLKVAPRFLNNKELADAGNDIRKLCILWCAKEALYKIYSAKGLVFRENLMVAPFERKQEGILSCTISVGEYLQKYLVKYEDRGEFLIAFNQ